jgi:hypothetical protein
VLLELQVVKEFLDLKVVLDHEDQQDFEEILDFQGRLVNPVDLDSKDPKDLEEILVILELPEHLDLLGWPDRLGNKECLVIRVPPVQLDQQDRPVLAVQRVILEVQDRRVTLVQLGQLEVSVHLVQQAHQVILDQWEPLDRLVILVNQEMLDNKDLKVQVEIPDL